MAGPASASAILPRRFYERDTVTVAEELLGKSIVRTIEGTTLTGVIVETEAYRGADDPASHAHKGRTHRNSVMFDHGGLAYVYFIYGKNWCLNATTERPGQPGAVLIRALEPVTGVGQMAARRRITDVTDLASGPGKLTEALGITGAQNGCDMTRRGELYVRDSSPLPKALLIATRRIGVSSGTDLLWRFSVQGSPYVSRRDRLSSISDPPTGFPG